MAELPPSDELRHEMALRVVAELVPEVQGGPMSPIHVTRAGRIMAERQNINHRTMHADAQRAGAVVWEMRQMGMSWRAIYDSTGIVQRTGDRWQKLFVAEGIAARPAAELDQRWQGLNGTER